MVCLVFVRFRRGTERKMILSLNPNLSLVPALAPGQRQPQQSDPQQPSLSRPQP